MLSRIEQVQHRSGIRLQGKLRRHRHTVSSGRLTTVSVRYFDGTRKHADLCDDVPWLTGDRVEF